MSAYYAYTSGPGFSGPVSAGEPDGDVTNQRNATRAHLRSLVKSASYAISVAAIALGQAAETFWRDGKCVELTVDPQGGDVDAGSTTEVTATLRHIFEGRELDKPVAATLAGVATIDPADAKQPAPATVRYTAGPNEADEGTIAFESVSKRGIAKRSLTFIVRPAVWKVTFRGTDVEVMGPVSSNFQATIAELTITSDNGTLTGAGKLHLKGTVVSGPCSGPLDQLAPVKVTGNPRGDRPSGYAQDRAAGNLAAW